MRYICSGCLRSLSQDLYLAVARLKQSPDLRAFSSATSLGHSTSPDEHTQAIYTKLKRAEKGAEQIRAANGSTAEHPHTRSWRTLLTKKSLGKDSSVLVLRDSEGKKGARSHVARNEDIEEPISDTAVPQANNILSSLIKQGSTPQQSEINEIISSLRPKPPAYRGSFQNRPLISLERYERWVLRLAKSFTRKQLERYVAQHMDKERNVLQRAAKVATVNAATMDKTAKPSGAETASIVVQKHDWKPLDSLEFEAALRKQKPRSRVIYVAEKIVRLVWGFEVEEHVKGQGSLTIDISRSAVQALLAGGTHNLALSVLSKKHDSKIEVENLSQKSRITITGFREKCLRISDELDQLLQDPCEAKIKITREVAKLIKSLPQHKIGEYCCCQLHVSKSSLVIRGVSPSSVQMCQRVLASYIPLSPTRPIDRVNNYRVVDRRKTFLTPSPAIHDSLPYRLRGEDWGRLCVPQTLAIDSPILVSKHSPDDILPPRIRNTIENSLVQSRDASRETKSSLTAEFGHLLHRIEKETLLRRGLGDALPFSSHSANPFHPTLQGLPKLLLKSSLHSDSESRERFRIRFRPSPWRLSLSKATRTFPDLEMELSPPSDSSELQILWIKAVLKRQIVNIVLPNIGMDMRFVRQDFLHIPHDEQQLHVEGFIHQMRNSAAGFGGPEPPLLLRIRMPISAGDLQSEEESHEEVEYFATGLERVESTSLTHGDYSLCYHRTDGGAVYGNNEGVFMHTPIEDYPNMDKKTEEAAAREDVGRFISAATTLLKDLTSQDNRVAITPRSHRNSSTNRYRSTQRASYNPPHHRTFVGPGIHPDLGGIQSSGGQIRASVAD